MQIGAKLLAMGANKVARKECANVVADCMDRNQRDEVCERFATER